MNEDVVIFVHYGSPLNIISWSTMTLAIPSMSLSIVGLLPIQLISAVMTVIDYDYILLLISVFSAAMVAERFSRNTVQLSSFPSSTHPPRINRC